MVTVHLLMVWSVVSGEFVGMMSGRFNAVTFKKFLTVLIKRGKGKKM
ncbi:MAG: hypothetical protein ACYCT2_09580 [Thermoplasmataceae archaeon]